MSLWWDIIYWLKQTPWDTGITPPEIVSMIDSGRVKVGRALDLGCGTGTNASYLAQHGFDVTGIDLSRRAISMARRKARSANCAIRFIRGDVSQMQKWIAPDSIDFAYDIGCFHSLPDAARRRYAGALTHVIRSGAVFMLYAFGPRIDTSGSRAAGASPAEVADRFAPGCLIEKVEQGGDRNGRSSAWYTLERI